MSGYRYEANRVTRPARFQDRLVEQSNQSRLRSLLTRAFPCPTPLFPSGHIPPPHALRWWRSLRRHARFLRSPANPQFIQKVAALAPVFFHFHKQFEMPAMAQKLFNLQPRLRADLVQTLRATADNDFLLRGSFDKNGAVDTREIGACCCPAFGHYRSYVGKLFTGCFENLLAHNLSGERTHRLICQLIFRKQGFAGRKLLNDLSEKNFDLIPFQSRYGHDRAP